MGNWWRLFGLFLIPFGAGIPFGVLFGRDAGIAWPLIALTYLLSDIIQAFFYEWLIVWMISASKKSPRMAETALRFKQNLEFMGFTNLIAPSHLTLFWLSLSDPFTSRIVGHLAGYKPLIGWAIAIAGDMIFFGAVMSSTLWLNNVLGNGTMAALISTTLFVVIPSLFNRLRKKHA